MTTFISKITASVLALSLTLSCSSVLAADKKTVAAKPKPSTQHPKKAPSFMFVIDAKQGEIKKDKNGQYHLILQKVDMNQVIMFSDRPQRIVKYITGKDLQSLWKEGKNSFEKDPPNAVLSGTGIKTQIVILNGIDEANASLSISISDGIVDNNNSPLAVNRLSKNVLLVIDGYHNYCCDLQCTTIDLCCFSMDRKHRFHNNQCF